MDGKKAALLKALLVLTFFTYFLSINNDIQDLDPAQWQPMFELGMLVEKLRIGAYRAWFIVHAAGEAERLVLRGLLKQHNAQVRVGLRWL